MVAAYLDFCISRTWKTLDFCWWRMEWRRSCSSNRLDNKRIFMQKLDFSCGILRQCNRLAYSVTLRRWRGQKVWVIRQESQLSLTDCASTGEVNFAVKQLQTRLYKVIVIDVIWQSTYNFLIVIHLSVALSRTISEIFTLLLRTSLPVTFNSPSFLIDNKN